MNNSCDYAIVGGGILGLATAYQLQKKFPDKRIFVFEKEEILASHQTGNNSGVIHSGLYYKPGSKKALLCAEGKKMLVNFAREHSVPFEICGKIVVATQEKEIPYLDKIYKNGIANGCEGIEYIDSHQIKEIEPFCEGIKGIKVPTTGIIDYPKFTQALADELVKIQPMSKIFLGHKVQDFSEKDGFTILNCNGKKFKTEFLVCCGGLFADKLALKDKFEKRIKIVPFRGDYYDLTPKAQHKVKHLIYPVPDPDFPFLGVHFTRMIKGGVECGPNAVFSFKREGYNKTSFSLRDSWDALIFIGLWNLFKKHWRQGIEEYKRAYSKRLFLKSLQRLIPSLTMEDIQPARSGVRAQALDSEGNLVYDFEIFQVGKHLHVLNAPSPAATACLAIGQHVVNKLTE